MNRVFRRCKGCTDRHVGCHSECKYYKEDIEEWQKMKEYINFDKEERKYLDSKLYRYLDWKAKETRNK